MTDIPDEIAKLDNGTFVGWARTGQSFAVYSDYPAGSMGVCRFFSTSFTPRSSHFYTSDPNECGVVKLNKDWQFEGVVFGLLSPGPAGDCPAGTRADLPAVQQRPGRRAQPPLHDERGDPHADDRAGLDSRGLRPAGRHHVLAGLGVGPLGDSRSARTRPTLRMLRCGGVGPRSCVDRDAQRSDPRLRSV